ncbi:MAG: hypothetical protein HOI25_12780 [Proteobacteria bacterium]|nr:hypothetical protein [Pseudomonadota bacterium]
MVKAVCIRVRHVVLSAENLCHDPAGFDTGEAFIQLLVREDQTAVIDAPAGAALLRESHECRRGLLPRCNKDRQKVAGIPKTDECGRAVDIHAMRMTLATMLNRAGVVEPGGSRSPHSSGNHASLRHPADDGDVHGGQTVERQRGSGFSSKAHAGQEHRERTGIDASHRNRWNRGFRVSPKRWRPGENRVVS